MSLAEQLHTQLQALEPAYLEIMNESMKHLGYYEGKESHFKVNIVSDKFTNLRLVQRHQRIYELVENLLGGGKIHALALHTYTPEEWTGLSPNSPQCQHSVKNRRDYE